MITKEQLIELGANKFNAEKYIDHINEVLVKYEINTNARICHFLAQVFHESGALTISRESLNYSAEGLLNRFKKYFPTLESTKGYARTATEPANQVAIGNKVYGNRMGNGPLEGYLYRGRGLIQCTGKGLYQSLSKAFGTDFVAQPELLEQPRYAALTAGHFWKGIKANDIADIDSEASVKTITKLVNGGYNGLEERLSFYRKAKRIFK